MATSHQLPLNYSISSSLARADALPSLLPALSPCALSPCPSVQAVGGSCIPPAPAGSRLGGQRLFLLGPGLPSGWEKDKLEHPSCSPTNAPSCHPPFSTPSQASPSALSVCHSGTQGTTQTHLSHGEHFVPPPRQAGGNWFKFIFNPLTSRLSLQRFSRFLASPWGFFSPSHPSPHLREPKLVTGWGRSCSSPRFGQSPLFPRSLA